MTPTTSNDYPEWFRLGNPLMWGIPKAVYDFVSSGTALSTNHENAVRCATIHFIHCLNLSVESNRKGQHAVAICLCRQCAEALTVMEIGLIPSLGKRPIHMPITLPSCNLGRLPWPEIMRTKIATATICFWLELA